MYLLWNLPFFKMVPPKTNFFLFSNLGLIMAQQTRILVNCFMTRVGVGDDTPHAIWSQKCILWGRGLVKILQPCGVSLISFNSFLTDITSSQVWMWELDYKENWAPKNWYFWTVILEKTLESPLDCKEIQPVRPKGNQSWISLGRTDAKAETPILWPPHAKS